MPRRFFFCTIRGGVTRFTKLMIRQWRMTMTRNKCLLMKSLVGFSACAFLTLQAQTWTGSTSSDWNTAANWNTGVPNGSAGNVIYDGAGITPVFNVAYSAVAHLRVGLSSAGTLTISDGASLNNPARGYLMGRVGNSVVNQTGGSITTGYHFQGADAGTTGSATVTQSGGSVSAGQFNLGGNESNANSIWNADGGTLSGGAFIRLSGSTGLGTGQGVLNIDGGDVSANSLQNNFSATGGKLTLSSGSLTVSGVIDYDDPDGAAFNVGSTATLNLGQATHVFDHGLSVVGGGTIGTGNNSATVATIDNTGGSADFTLQNGATIDYSIRGTDNTSDTLSFLSNADADFGTAPTALNLVVDVVAGDVKQTAGPFAIFDFGGTAPTGWDSITWTITTAEGTRLSSPGSVIVGDGLNGLAIGEIGLSGFEAFSIPEPSTAMLFGLGAMVMLLRRRIK